MTMQELFRETRAAKAKVRSAGRRRPAGPARWRPAPARQCRPRPLRARQEQDQGADPRGRRPGRPQPVAATAARPAALGSPVNGSVTSPFGYRVHPIYHYRAMHNGTDFGAGCGQPVYGQRRNSDDRYYSSWEPPLPQPRHGQRQEPHLIYNHLSGYAAGTGQRVAARSSVRRRHRLVHRLPPPLHGDGQRHRCGPHELASCCSIARERIDRA